MSGLPNRIRKLRRKRGLSQEIFAKSLGVSRSHISTIETGAARPSKQLIKSICREFGVREKWLLEGKKLLSEEDGLSNDEIEDFELDIRNISNTGLYNILDGYCDIILTMEESLWEYSFAFREIGKPDIRLLEIKAELDSSLDSLKRQLKWFFNILRNQEHIKFKSLKEIKELLIKQKSLVKKKLDKNK